MVDKVIIEMCNHILSIEKSEGMGYSDNIRFAIEEYRSKYFSDLIRKLEKIHIDIRDTDFQQDKDINKYNIRKLGELIQELKDYDYNQ